MIPFIPVNCAAIPKDLVESELFGYEKGAFSGAGASGKKGLIEAAANGTLFLDEVGDLGLDAQAKLLRFLETGEFYRVGGTKKIQIETRIVSATNKKLDSMIEKGLFRKDLYFRVGVVKIQAPSLNERRGDILPLAKHFLVAFSNKFGKAFTGISANAEHALMTHNWTGHVRELKNLMEMGVLMGKGPLLEAADLGLVKKIENDTPRKATDEIIFPPLPLQGIDFVSAQESLERYYIGEAFRMAGGNEIKAAKLLNMNHHTFRYRRKKLQIK